MIYATIQLTAPLIIFSFYHTILPIHLECFLIIKWCPGNADFAADLDSTSIVFPTLIALALYLYSSGCIGLTAMYAIAMNL